MDGALREIRQAVRLLLKDRTFSVTVLSTLAVCIGANVSIFSVVLAVLLDPLPYPNAERLVTVFNSYPGAGAARGANGSVDFFERREKVAAFEEVAVFRPAGNTVGEIGRTQRMSSLRVSPSFFPVLGAEAAMGRTFTEDEMEPGSHRKVVLTDAFWKDYFGGLPDVVGRELRVDGESHTVVGVMPRDFTVLGRAETRFFLPTPFTEESRQVDQWHNNNYQMIARLRAGATVEQAIAQNLALNEALMDAWPLPNAREILRDAGYTVEVVPTRQDLVRDLRPILYTLWAGVGLVLLIGCVNVANLMLARAQTRVADVATRLALGARRTRIARMVLTEVTVIGLAGATLGVGVGAVGLELLRRLGSSSLPRGSTIGIDGTVLLFTLALALGTGLVFGAIPVFQLARGDLTPVFRSQARTGSASRRAALLRNGLVVGQVSLAFVLLIGGGLMLLTFRSAMSVDPGFTAEGVLTASVALPESRYEDGDARRRFFDELVESIRAVPGVESAAVSTQLPFTGGNSSSVIFPEGYVPGPGESLLAPLSDEVAPGYFATMGIEVLTGRGFEYQDGPERERVIVIDRWLAERYWPGRSPLGDRMVVGAVPGMDSIPEENLYTVVGVVATIKHNDLTTLPSEHVGAYYFSLRQRPRGFATLAVRAATDPEALTPTLREIVTELDPELPLFGVQTMQSRIDESLLSRRVPLVLLGVFGLVALFLAVVGVYGALAYSVTQRSKELGIRMAMGSAPRSLFRSVVRQGMGVTAVGLTIGALASLTLTGLMRSMLYGVEPSDPRVMLAVAGTLLAVGFFACLVPARRATRVDPMSVLGA